MEYHQNNITAVAQHSVLLTEAPPKCNSTIKGDSFQVFKQSIPKLFEDCVNWYVLYYNIHTGDIDIDI